MIKQFNGQKSEAQASFTQLPKGGYVVKIMGAEVCENSRGQYIKIGIDIAEGEYAGYYEKDYRSQTGENKKWRGNFLLSVPTDDGSEQDGWTKKKFNNFTWALEESNKGYHFDWDESKFKGKLIGGLFSIKEYTKNDGAVGSATNMTSVTSVDAIKEGKYKLPADKLIQKSEPVTNDSDFMKLKDGLEEDLPFV